MRPGEKHPGREEMIRAIQTDSVRFRSHLKHCQACREMFELLSEMSAAAKTDETKPSMESIYRHMAVARMIESRHPANTIDGRTVFDSWSDLSVVQTRDSGYGVERRLRFGADRFVLELVAEHQQGRWHFVARVYDGSHVSRDFILQAGRKKHYPQGHRCFFWSSSRPPAKIQLLSPSYRIVMDRLSW